jgi:TatD DNase family protein
VLLETALDGGWYISISGIVTFRNWAEDDLLRLIPDDRLLVESDAPYLAPVPNRGKRNEPAWVAHTVARVAAVRGAAAETVGDLSARNAGRLFGF